MNLLTPLHPAAHPLVLVDDRDGLLDDEAARAELLARGYRLIDDGDGVEGGDPVRLRAAVGRRPAWSAGGTPATGAEAGAAGAATPADQALVIITRRPLNQLPYDWWATAHPVTLRLAERHPALNATVLRELRGAEQRWRLAQAAPPPGRLGREATADYLLRAVFAADGAALTAPAALIAWLARLHHDLPGPLPPALRERLLARLSAVPALAGWPLADLLDDPAAFGRFVAGQWAGYVAATGGEDAGWQPALHEAAPAYRLDFAGDAALQDALPLLARRGVLPRLVVRDAARLPDWAAPGVRRAAEEDPRQAAAVLLARLDEQAADLLAAPAAGRWPAWAAVAGTWAALTGVALDARDETIDDWLKERRPRLDAAFAAWLRARYAALAGQKLPRPHHVHHAPHLMAHERGRDGRPAALLVLDGLSLADWARVGRVWRARHPGWRLDEREPLLAQIPTITAVSRQALVSGKPPRDFAGSLGDNRREEAHWAAFWRGHGLGGAAVRYDRLRPGKPLAPGPAQALCLVYTGLDDQLHGATQGAAEAWQSLGLWLEREGRAVEAAVAELLAAGFAVYVGSDHGHTEAWGIGQPREGVTAESRGRRSRLYRTREAAAAQQLKFPLTAVWEPDGVLPEGVWPLLPSDQPARGAFEQGYRPVVAHGGLTLDEVVVPFVRIVEGT